MTTHFIYNNISPKFAINEIQRAGDITEKGSPTKGRRKGKWEKVKTRKLRVKSE